MKKTKRFNYRVVVEPAIYPFFSDTEQHIKAICERIKEEIKRHVDNVSNVYINWDTQAYCEHCGHGWEEDENGCPLCCDKAQEEWEAQKEDYNHVNRCATDAKMDKPNSIHRDFC